MLDLLLKITHHLVQQRLSIDIKQFYPYPTLQLAQIQQVGNQGHHPIGRILYAGDELGSVLLRDTRLGQKISRSFNNRERIFQIMGDGGDKLVL